MKPKNTDKTRLVATAITTVVLLVGCFASGPATAEEGCKRKRHSPSKRANRYLLHAGYREAADDFLTAVAKAEMITDASDRREARKEAIEEYRETVELAREQYHARMDLSEVLDEWRYDPEIDPDNFLTPAEIAANPNPWCPLVPGTTLRYEAETEDGKETITVTVTEDTREILGVTCIVVRDVVRLEGELIEDTHDWYAQDRDGNVWYFGEIAVNYEDGEISDVEGSWESGEDGAKPGILIKANPEAGDAHRQEMLLGEAEDAAEVVALDQTVTVPAGTFNGCVQAGEFTPIEPDAYEYKYSAPGVGTVLEVDTESGERVELVAIERP